MSETPKQSIQFLDPAFTKGKFMIARLDLETASYEQRQMLVSSMRSMKEKLGCSDLIILPNTITVDMVTEAEINSLGKGFMAELEQLGAKKE